MMAGFEASQPVKCPCCGIVIQVQMVEFPARSATERDTIEAFAWVPTDATSTWPELSVGASMDEALLRLLEAE